MPHPARGRVDQHVIAGPQTAGAQRTQRDLATARDHQRRRVVDAVGHRDREPGADRRVLGVRRAEGQPGDPLADLPARHVRAEADHRADDLAARRVRQFDGAAARQPDDGEGDARQPDPHQQFVRTRFRHLDILDAQHFRPAIGMKCDSTHVAHLPNRLQRC